MPGTKGKSGGLRYGAGRKSFPQNIAEIGVHKLKKLNRDINYYRAQVEDAELELTGKALPLMKAALERALGGDTEMIRYCLDRIYGKPTQSMVIANVNTKALESLEKIREAVDADYTTIPESLDGASDLSEESTEGESDWSDPKHIEDNTNSDPSRDSILSDKE